MEIVWIAVLLNEFILNASCLAVPVKVRTFNSFEFIVDSLPLFGRVFGGHAHVNKCQIAYEYNAPK